LLLNVESPETHFSLFILLFDVILKTIFGTVLHFKFQFLCPVPFVGQKFSYLKLLTHELNLLTDLSPDSIVSQVHKLKKKCKQLFGKFPSFIADVFIFFVTKNLFVLTRFFLFKVE
jgi:hypothetical protein